MNKKTSKYFFIILIFLIFININLISAEIIDQNTASNPEHILSDTIGIDKISITANPDKEIADNCDNEENKAYDINIANSPNENTNTANNQNNQNENTNTANNQNNQNENTNTANNLNSQNDTANITGNTESNPNESNANAASLNQTSSSKQIANPIYTKLSIEKTGFIKNEYLKIYLKTKKGKALSKQKIRITINGKTFTKTTDKKGMVKLKLNLKSNIYDLSIAYDGKSNYMPSSKKTKINVLNSKIIGKTKYGKVYFQGIIGNRSSKVRIAYVVGLHILEHQIHESVYKIMKNKVNMKYKYYIYRIVLTKKAGDYSIDRMRGQKLAKKFIVPHAKKQKYNLVIDIHSTTGTSYAKTYFIHVPKNKHKASMKLAKKTINAIKKIEKNSKMVYWSPASQTSPPYIHLPLIKAGTPTFVFETWTYEKKTQTNKRANILISAVDTIFD